MAAKKPKMSFFLPMKVVVRPYLGIGRKNDTIPEIILGVGRPGRRVQMKNTSYIMANSNGHALMKYT